MSYRDKGNHGGRGGRFGRNNRGDNRGSRDFSPYNRSQRNSSHSNTNDPEDMLVRLNMLILKIGDKVTTSLEKNIDTLSKVLIKDILKHAESINETLLTCISELPSKTPTYGCLVALVFARSPDTGSQILNFVFKAFQNSFNQGQWRTVKILLRFFGELVKCNLVATTCLLNLYRAILSPLDSKVNKDLGDCMIQLVLGSLPWAGKLLSEKNKAELEQILEKIESYVYSRSSSTDFRAGILKVYPSSISSEEHDFIDLLLTQVKECQERDWEVVELLKPYESFNDIFSTSTMFELPKFELPETLNELHFLPPHVQFTVFPQHELLLPTIGYYIISDIISDSIDIFHSNRRECIRLLFTLNEVFSTNAFAPSSDNQKLTGEHKPKDQEDMDTDSVKGESEAEIKLETASEKNSLELVHLITESIFRKLFQLPEPTNKVTYYGVLFFEAFKTFPNQFPSIFKEALDIIFSKANDMDIECVERLYNWLSQHLSNFEYKWDWESWSVALEADKYSPQKIVVKETLGKLIRLSYYDRVKANVPASFLPLFPPKGPEPLFSFSAPAEDSPYKIFCASILDAFKHKKPIDEILTLIKEGIEDLDEAIVRQISIETLLLLGSKSISHMMNVIEKFLPIFQFFTVESDDKDATIKVAAHFWRENPQWLGIQMDKFMNYHLVEPINVVNWVFSSSNIDQISSAFIWEILYDTLNKLILWVEQQKTNLKNASIDNENAMADDLLETSNYAQKDLREYILAVFQHFIRILTEKLSELDSQEELPEENLWYTYVIGRMKGFGRRYHNIIKDNINTIESIAFNSSVDERLLHVFEEIKSLSEAPMIGN